jgi:hypothetical protein
VLTQPLKKTVARSARASLRNATVGKLPARGQAAHGGGEVRRVGRGLRSKAISTALRFRCPGSARAGAYGTEEAPDNRGAPRLSRPCGLTFELRRPVRWAALGPRRIMEPATGLRGPRVARLAGSPLERGVRPQSCRSVPRWSDLGPEPWFRSEDTGPARAVPRRCFRRLPAGREAPSAGRCRPPAHLTATETSLRRAAAPALMVTAPLETPN